VARDPSSVNIVPQRDVQEVASLPGVFVRTRLIIFAAILAAGAVPSAQNDLDAFMSQVLAQRDQNWKKLQQYILDEDETFQLTGPEGKRLFGTHREYNWFPRDGFFVRSPTRADGVTISEGDRRKAEDAWLRGEQQREERRKTRAAQKPGDTSPADRDVQIDIDVDNQSAAAPGLDDLVKAGNEPRFISSAYFMRFKFDPGHYALAGRESSPRRFGSSRNHGGGIRCRPASRSRAGTRSCLRRRSGQCCGM